MLTPLVSFYADVDGTKYYSDNAERLKKQCEELLVPCYIRERESKGNWLKNTNQKPSFILEMFDELKSPFFWFDVDYKLLKAPCLLDTLDCDIASVQHPWLTKGKGLWVQDLLHYFSYTPIVREFLVNWKEKCDKQEPVWMDDHRHCCSLLANFRGKFVYLPKSYFNGDVMRSAKRVSIISRTIAYKRLHEMRIEP